MTAVPHEETPAAADKTAAEPPRIKLRARLFFKYAAIVFAVVLVALVINVAFEVWFSYQENKASLVRIQHEQAEAAAAKIGEFIKGIEAQVGWTTQLPWSTATLEQRRFDALRLLRQVPAITELSELDSTGHEQLRVSRLAMDVIGSQIDYSKDPKFLEAMAKKVYYGPVYFRRESEPYMTIALAGTRRDAGVSVAEVNLKFIWDVVSQIRVGERGRAYVIDAPGRLIAHPDISLVLRNTDVSRLPQVEAARANLAGTPAEQVQESTDIQGQRVLTAYAPVPPLGWLVFVDLPVEEAYAPLYASIRRSAILLVAGLVLALIAGLILARKMVIPIRALREGAARIGAGDLSQRISVKTGDELEALADQFNDMTAKLQESYSDLEHKVETRTHELSEALEQQTATSEVLSVISASPGELEPVFETILANATRLCAAKFGTLYLREGDSFRAVAVYNAPPGFAEMRRREPLSRPPAGSTLDRLLVTRMPVQLADITQEAGYIAGDPFVVSAADLGNFRTVLSVPMLKDNELIGAITIYRQEVEPFGPKQVELVGNFAAQAVIAIENTRLLNELRQRTSDLSESLEQQTATSEVLQVISASPGELEPVFAAMLDNATRICDAPFGNLWLKEGDTYRIVAIHGTDADLRTFVTGLAAIHLDPDLPLARVEASRRVLQVNDITEEPAYRRGAPTLKGLADIGGARTLLVVPMLKENVVVGAITIYRKEVRPFADKQVELVSNFASQAVIAIENTRLLKELRQRTTDLAKSVSELRALGEVSQAVNSTLDLETVLETIAARAVALSGTEAGAIYVYEASDKEFHLRATCGMSGELIEAVQSQHGALSATVYEAVEAGEPAQAPDLRTEPPLEINQIMLAAGFRARLLIPLMRLDDVIGALVVRRRAPGEFDRGTIDLLKTFAAQSILAIQNARLFTEIDEKSRQLEIASQHKSQFLANMSHELRTPLNAILGYTELILDGIYGDTPEKMRTVLERVQTNGKHLLGLINDVLDLSKIEAGQLTLSLGDYSLKDMVHGVFAAVESLANNKSIALKVDVGQNLPSGRGDERRLAQVLLNLVGNAIKFTDAGEVAISAGAENGSFVVGVRDTGPGIAPGDQAKIFEEFQQADSSATKKKGGTGLGLSIARRIVEMHGGRLWVESAPGEGSTFWFTVPVNVEKQAAR